MTEPLTGHEHSWKLFCDLDPDGVCTRGGADYDHKTGIYSICSFGQIIYISLNEQKVLGNSEVGDYLIGESGQFFDLALLWYCISAKDIAASEELVRPSEIKGGQIFVTGTHVLPLEEIEEKYGSEPDSFIERGNLLGGEVLDHGDASVKIWPFPKLPVTLILWREDDEFPAKVDFFFHKGCDEQLPTDVLWSTAMVTVLAMAAEFNSNEIVRNM